MKPYPIRCVSIVIPVYNEQESLPELLRRTTAACKQLAYEYEIILVDDGSRDNSAQLLEDAADDPVLEPAPGETPLWPTVIATSGTSMFGKRVIGSALND